LRIEGATRIKDIRPASNLTALSEFVIARCSELEDITALAALSNLERVRLVSCRKLADLSPLAKLRNLKEITLVDCASVKSLSPLSNNFGLEKIRLGELDSKRMQIPEVLLPRVESTNMLFAHSTGLHFEDDHFYYRYYDFDEPLFVYRHGVEMEVVPMFPDETDIDLE